MAGYTLTLSIYTIVIRDSKKMMRLKQNIIILQVK